MDNTGTDETKIKTVTDETKIKFLVDKYTKEEIAKDYVRLENFCTKIFLEKEELQQEFSIPDYDMGTMEMEEEGEEDIFISDEWEKV